MRFYEAYLTYLYLAIKFLFLVNVLLQVNLPLFLLLNQFQMFLLSKFLKTNDQGFYGYSIIWGLVMGNGWTESPNFPVVTYCDMQIRILGHVQRHTVQCVLVINIFTEKVEILLFLREGAGSDIPAPLVVVYSPRYRLLRQYHVLDLLLSTI